MKVQATKTMCKAIRDNIKLSCIDSILYNVISADNYRLNIDYDLFRAYDNGDVFHDKNGYLVGRYICIVYKPECYALPRYITTADLVRVFRHSDKTFEGFFAALADEIEI